MLFVASTSAERRRRRRNEETTVLNVRVWYVREKRERERSMKECSSYIGTCQLCTNEDQANKQIVPNLRFIRKIQGERANESERRRNRTDHQDKEHIR